MNTVAGFTTAGKDCHPLLWHTNAHAHCGVVYKDGRRRSPCFPIAMLFFSTASRSWTRPQQILCAVIGQEKKLTGSDYITFQYRLFYRRREKYQWADEDQRLCLREITWTRCCQMLHLKLCVISILYNVIKHNREYNNRLFHIDLLTIANFHLFIYDMLFLTVYSSL